MSFVGSSTTVEDLSIVRLLIGVIAKARNWSFTPKAVLVFIYQKAHFRIHAMIYNGPTLGCKIVQIFNYFISETINLLLLFHKL